MIRFFLILAGLAFFLGNFESLHSEVCHMTKEHSSSIEKSTGESTTTGKFGFDECSGACLGCFHSHFPSYITTSVRLDNPLVKIAQFRLFNSAIRSLALSQQLFRPPRVL